MRAARRSRRDGGASSCITRDVPADALALERSEETIIEGYAAKRRERMKKGQD